jgi:hypothetical protein
VDRPKDSFNSVTEEDLRAIVAKLVERAKAAIARYAEQETLYDQPYEDRSKVRVTGPKQEL